MDFAKKAKKPWTSILLIKIRQPLLKNFQKAKMLQKYAALIPSVKKDA